MTSAPEDQYLRDFADFDEDWVWRSRSICRDLPDADKLFFPEGTEVTGMPPAVFTRRAKAICKECPVIAECLDYALRYRLTEFGVYGGMTAPERKRHLKAIAENQDQEIATIA